MKRYPSRYEGPETAPALCIQLLKQASPARGIVLDLGCGRAPLAEPVSEMGHEYVGVDVDLDALTEVSVRGFETHSLDLGGGEEDLVAALRGVVEGRRVAMVLAADLLEHLVAPDVLLRAIRTLDGAGSLIVSIPNVTHLNVGAKLLMGRWDPTECGLLDDTHLRHFSEAVLVRLFRATGWRQVDSADAEDPDSPDQRFPPDSPTLRPGTPARDLLRRLRSAGEPHASTYQFVRRFVPEAVPAETRYRWAVDSELDQARVFASVLVQTAGEGGAPRERLLADLEAQTVKEFETVEVSNGAEGLNSGIEASTGRYLCFLDRNTRVSPRWIESFQDFPESLGGRVLKANAVSVAPGQLGLEDAEDLIESGKPLQMSCLDLLAPERPEPTVLAAYAVPADAVRAAGLHFEPEYGDAAPAVFLSGVAELSGVLPQATRTVAVAKDAARASEEVLAAVAESLDRAPLILPAGSATRILVMRQALTRSARWRIRNRLRQLKRFLDRFRTSE